MSASPWMTTRGTLEEIAAYRVKVRIPEYPEIFAHASRPQFVYRHRWQKNDLLMWDNRCTNHIAVNDYDKAKVRHLERTTVMGTPSGRVYEGVTQSRSGTK